jgi:hypothetical protein
MVGRDAAEPTPTRAHSRSKNQTFFPRRPGPSSATRKCPSELTSRFALLSFREFKNARLVIVDRAGYREVVKQAIGCHL